MTEALVEAGVAPSRLVLVEFDPTFCRLLRSRYPEATLVQGDAYGMRRLLETLAAAAGGRGGVRPAAGHQADEDAPAAYSRCLRPDAAGAPFVQFTYSVASPLPRRLGGFTGRGLRAHLDEYPAGARLGLSQGLT